MARLLLLVLGLIASAFAQNFYEILGVAKDADENVIKKAYRKLSLKYHPGTSMLPRRVAQLQSK